MWLFHKRELTTTLDGAFYHRVCEMLTLKGIKYRTRYVTTASHGRSRGYIGSVGDNGSGQYYVYVLKKDLENARELLKLI